MDKIFLYFSPTYLPCPPALREGVREADPVVEPVRQERVEELLANGFDRKKRFFFTKFRQS